MLGFSEPRLFAEDERAFLTELAAVGAQAAERADLYDAQAELASRLAKLQEGTTALTAAQEGQAGEVEVGIGLVVLEAPHDGA